MLMHMTAVFAYALARLSVGCPPHKIRTTTRSTAPQLIEPAGELLSLQVSSPALLLNHMAERYTSTSRILMEFVDNSLDDAESLYDSAAGASAWSKCSLGSAPARLLCLLRARLAALDSSALPG